MFISVGHNKLIFKPVEVQSFKGLCDVMLRKDITAYSLGTFKENKRNIKNFIRTKCIGLDIDNDARQTMTLNQAKARFKKYRHIICTSKSHQIPKNGTTTDRFRVILFFAKYVETSEDFYRAWHGLENEFPEIDPSCKDPSRFWFPSKEVIQIQKTGKFVSIPEKIAEKPSTKTKTAQTQGFGKLSHYTTQFFCVGSEPGTRHNMLFKVTVDCREQGYPKEYVVSMIQNMINNTGQWPTKEVSANDMKTIDDVYNRELKYDKRKSDSPFNFKHLSETLEDETQTDWLVDGLLTVGGFSLIAGQPKSGKSTIIRQMCLSVAQGTDFLGRNVSQGKVYYLALEEQSTIIRDEITLQGAQIKDPIYIHYGPCGQNPDLLQGLLAENHVKLLVIDTMALFIGVDDINNYSAVNKLLAECRNVARNSGTHICMIHHQNKSDIGGAKTIMGSNSIHGSIDNAIIFESAGKYRYLTTSQRGGKRFIDQKLQFNPKNLLYSLVKLKLKPNKQDDDGGF